MMSRKFVRVRGGMIIFDFPEDIPAWEQALLKIRLKAYDILARKRIENEDVLNHEMRETNRREFESVFGEGSCQYTFLTDLPSLTAILEFQEKFKYLLEDWTRKEIEEIRKSLGNREAKKMERQWKQVKRNSIIFKKF
ncbi:MAG: hypothetical protein KH452_01690 [Clostridiales bacterium]|nr:hypothetical protein [Clostridiales bacterium]